MKVPIDIQLERISWQLFIFPPLAQTVCEDSLHWRYLSDPWGTPTSVGVWRSQKGKTAEQYKNPSKGIFKLHQML